MEIRDVAVIGLGTMGAGIAEVLARGGLRVTAVEADPEALSRGMAAISGSLARAVAKGRLAEPERAEILARVNPAPGIADAAHADLAIEVVPERMEIKRQVFAELDRACRADAILATNTSSLPVTAIAAGTAHPQRVVGTHFFNPAPVMRLVEVIPTVLAESGVIEAVTALVRRLGKTPVTVADRAGFVANALLLPYLNHAVTMLETGYASREDIDTAMREGAGLPMGPLTLLDLIGLDTSLSVLEVLAGEFGGSRHQAAPLLRRLTDAGLLGRKSGRGFYEHSPAAQAAAEEPEIAPPGSVVLAGRPGAELAALVEAAGIAVTRLAAGGPAADAGTGNGGPARAGAGAGGDLLLIEASLDEDVLGAAIAAGAPGAVGLRLAGGGLAEVVSTRLSAPGAAERAAGLARRLGLTPVRCPDRPGLLAAGLLYPHLNDAARMVGDNYATAADVDAAMRLGCGYPRGPLQMADEIGAQRLHAVLTRMHQRTGDPAFAPAQLLAEHAAAGLTFHETPGPAPGR